MAYAHEWPSKRRKIDAPCPPSNPGPFTHQNLKIKEAALEDDKQILNEYEWATYHNSAPKLKEAVEEVLLKDIIMQ
jgi:hypothetical protein